MSQEYACTSAAARWAEPWATSYRAFFVTSWAAAGGGNSSLLQSLQERLEVAYRTEVQTQAATRYATFRRHLQREGAAEARLRRPREQFPASELPGSILVGLIS